MAVFLILVFAVELSFAQWVPSFREGREIAEREGKLILIYFYEEGCAYCRRMEELVFPDRRVDEVIGKAFLVVPVNVEDIPQDLDRRFRTVGTPSLLVYDPAADRVVIQLFGLQEAGELAELLGEICRRKGRC